MKKMRKLFVVFVLAVSLFTLTGCSKEFKKAGITITLDSSFHESEHEDFQVVYLSNKFGFSGNGENKSELVTSNIATLEEYSKAVLEVAKKDDLVMENVYEEENKISFQYTFFTQDVEGEEFKYMIITKEGKDKFYVMNLWCLESNFNDKTKTKMMDWAKSIKVE